MQRFLTADDAAALPNGTSTPTHDGADLSQLRDTATEIRAKVLSLLQEHHPESGLLRRVQARVLEATGVIEDALQRYGCVFPSSILLPPPGPGKTEQSNSSFLTFLQKTLQK